MKITLVIFLCLSLLMTGCEILSAPFKLMAELLPLAIKYAPYALMFLEVPENMDSLPELRSEDFQNQVQKLAGENSSLPPLLPALTQEMRREKGKLHRLVAIHLTSMEKVEKVQQWMIENGKKFQIRYAIVGYDSQNAFENAQIRTLLEGQRTIAVLADGPLYTMAFSSSNAFSFDTPLAQ